MAAKDEMSGQMQ